MRGSDGNKKQPVPLKDLALANELKKLGNSRIGQIINAMRKKQNICLELLASIHKLYHVPRNMLEFVRKRIGTLYGDKIVLCLFNQVPVIVDPDGTLHV